MFIRCSACRATTWLDGPPARGERLDCSKCAQGYRVTEDRNEGWTVHTRLEAARECAMEHGIDLPSAYARFLGLEPIAGVVIDADALADSGEPDESAEPSATGEQLEETQEDHQWARIGNSPQALSRARDLAGQHRIPLELALEVVAERLTLERALRRHRSQERPPANAVSPVVGMIAVAALLLTAVGLGVSSWKKWDGAKQGAREHSRALAELASREKEALTHTAPVRRKKPAAARVLMDRDRQIVEVSGRTPQAVLNAFCKAPSAGGARLPLELASAVPDRRGIRLGVYRDVTDLSQLYAIRIRLSRGRWVAGTRREPLESFAVDDEMLGPPRVPVSGPPS